MLMQPVNDAAARTLGKAPLSTCVTFGIGTIGTALLLNAVIVYFPAMMTTVLGEPAAVAGLLLMFSKLYDAFADMAIGLLSDRMRSRWGRRRPYLLVGSIVAAASFIMIFAPPAVHGVWLFLYMGCALIVYSTGYSLFNVPYTAMPAEVLTGYHERTRVLSWRSAFAAAGQLVALSGTAWVLGHGHGSAASYATMAVLGGAIVLVTLLTTFFGSFAFPAAQTNSARHAAPRLGLRERVQLVLSNRPFVMLMAAKFVHFVALSGLFSTTLLFNLDVLHVGYQGQMVLSLSQNILSIVTMPLWVRLSRIVGKRWTYIIAILSFGIASMTWLFAEPGDGIWTLWARGALVGFGAAGMILMSFAMLPDVIEYDSNRSGLARAGLYASIYSIFEKLGFATGPALSGIYLTVSGLRPSLHGQVVAQPHSAVIALYAGSSVIPMLMLSVSIICLLFYKLNEKELLLSRHAAETVSENTSSP